MIPEGKYTIYRYLYDAFRAEQIRAELAFLRQQLPTSKWAMEIVAERSIEFYDLTSRMAEYENRPENRGKDLSNGRLHSK